MKFKFNLKREIKIVAAILSMVILIAFSERKFRDVAVHDVVVKVENIADNHFLDEQDVMGLMGLKEENLRGASVDKIDLRGLENRIRHDRFVKEAELYTDMRGDLIVKVNLQRPIARIVRANGPDGYIAEDGTIMPVSDKFNARVVLLSGSFVDQVVKLSNLSESEDGTKLKELIDRIRMNEFWRAQVAQLDIDSKGNVDIYPQIGGQVIEFGKLDKQEEKLLKLKVFYKEILPRMGWNKYKRVNLEYEGQIVAE